MLDKDGYRPNVGIILLNSRNEVFWANALNSIRGSSRRVGSSTANRPSKRCIASSARKSG